MAADVTAPTAESLMEKYEQRRIKRPAGSAASGPDAEVDRDGEETATCGRCQREFTYLAVRVAGELIVPTRCRECMHLEEASVEQDVARHKAAKRERELADREARRLELLHAITGNAAEHRGMTLESFDYSECGTAVRQAMWDFCTDARSAGPYDPVRGLLLYGDTGNGKTHAAVAAGVNALLLDPSIDPAEIVFDRADELIMRIQDTYGSGRSTFDELLDRRFAARVWICDDLGTERASEDAARLLTLIFSRRALRPTIVTTNGDPEDWQQHRPELFRLVSRFGPRYFRSVAMTGRDRRFDAA